MATLTDAVTKTLRDYTQPAVAVAQEQMRDVQTAVVAGRQAAEQYAAEAAVQVRRHPVASLGVAVAIGALCGGLIGYTLGRFTRGASE